MTQFEEHRSRLFGIAYRMLGSAMEAEDMVQETFLRYDRADKDNIESPKAFLNTVITRLCIDQLRSAKEKRETYFGPWLPEPIITSNPSREIEQRDALSMAFLVLLESLTPLERAVFLLRSVFEYDYDEIASITGQSVAACRKSYSRARQHVHQHKPRFDAKPEEHQRMLVSFLEAVQQGDMDGLMAMLADDVQYWADGGGKTRAATRVVYGADAVAKILFGLLRVAPEGIQFSIEEVNGLPGIIIRLADGSLLSVTSIDVENNRIQAVHAVLNPEKLAGLVS